MLSNDTDTPYINVWVKKSFMDLYLAAAQGQLQMVQYFVENQEQSIQVKNDLGQTPLYCAAMNGHLNVIHYLVGRGADVKKEDEFDLNFLDRLALKKHFSVVAYLAKEKPIAVYTLREAAAKGYLGLVQYLVEAQDKDIHATDSLDETPLYKAAMNAHLNIVRYLVDRGANVKKESQFDLDFLNKLALNRHFSIVTYLAREKAIVLGTLREAVTKGYLGLVQYLVEAQHKDIHAKDHFLETLLQKAAVNGHVNILRYLLTQGANVRDLDEVAGDLLSDSVEKGHLDMLQYLIEERKMDFGSVYNWFLLQRAVDSDQLGIVKYLFHHRTNLNTSELEDLNFLNWVGLQGHFLMIDQLIAMPHTPPLPSLWEAAEKGYLGIAQYLVETQNKDIHATDGLDETPLYKAAVNGRADVFHYLLEKGAPLAPNDAMLQNLFETVAIKGHFSFLSYFLDHLSEKENISLPDLWEAAEKGYLGVMQYLVEVQHKDIHVKDSTGQTLLHMAAFHGHLALAQYLINRGADVNGKDNLAYSPLQKAAMNGHVDVLRHLLSQGANVEDIDEISEELLDDALEKGRLDMLQYLLEERNMDINSSDDFGWMPIERAAFNGQLAIVKYLFHRRNYLKINKMLDLFFLNRIALKGHFSVVDYFFAEQPPLPTLSETVAKGYLGMVRYLVETQDEDIHATDSLDETLLYKAVMDGRLNIVRYLVDRGVDLKKESRFDLDFLDKQALKKHFSVVAYLAKEKAMTLGSLGEVAAKGYLGLVQYLVEAQHKDIHMTDGFDETSLYKAAMNGHLNIVRYLVDRGADVKKESGFSLIFLNKLALKKHFSVVTYLATEKPIALNSLWEATKKGYLGIIQYLVEVQHKDIHVKDSTGQTLLHMAAFHGHSALVQYLINSGVDVNGKDNLAYSSLQKAAMNGHVDVLRHLLSQGANVEDIDEISEELLDDAVEKSRLDMLQYLLEERKMDIHSSDDFGWTLIERATLSGQLAVVKYLFDRKNYWKTNKRQDLFFLNRIAFKGHFSVVDYFFAEQPISLPTLWEIGEKNYLGIAKYLIEEKKIDVNKRDSEGWSLLGSAAYNGQLALVKYLLSQGANLVSENNVRYKAPLELAIEQGHFKIVQYLVEEKKLNLNVRNPLGWTFLDRAAHSGQLAIVKYLIRQGAEFESDNAPDLYFLDHIAFKGYFSVVQYLSDTKHMPLPTLWEAVEKGYLGILKYLVEEEGYDIHVKDSTDQSLLHKAAVYDHLNIMQYLIRQGVNLYETDRLEETPLDKAIKAGYLNIVKYFMLERKLNVHTKNYLNQTPLHQAVGNAHLNVIKYLLSQGADLNAVDKRGDTPVSEAVKAGYLTIVEYFIAEQGIDVNAHNHLGETLLHQAAISGRLNIVQYLLSQGADLNAVDSRGDTPVNKAIQAGRLNIVKYFTDTLRLDLGASDRFGWPLINQAAIRGQLEVIKHFFEIRRDDPNTAEAYAYLLHYAAYYGYLNVVRYLVEQNIDLTIQNSAGDTPLHSAILGNHLEIVKYLVEQGADLTRTDNNYNTPFQLAASQDNPAIVKYFLVHHNETTGDLLTAIQNNHLGVIRYLLEDKIVDLSSLDERYKQTALNKAIAYSYLDIVKYLVNNGFDHPVKPHLNLTSLHAAVESHRLEMVKYFIKENANLEAKDEHGYTALHIAVWDNDLEILEYLVEKGADLNTQNREGDTPLHTAVSDDYPDIVKYLLENGADSEVKNNFGNTARQSTTLAHQSPIVQYFESKKMARNRRAISAQTDHHLSITKTNDVIPSCASRPTSWINDGWRFLINMPLSLLTSSNTVLPKWDSANAGKDKADLKTASTHLDAMILLSGVIASKITKKKLGFFSTYTLSEEEVLNARVHAAIEKFSHLEETESCNNDTLLHLAKS